MPFVQKEGSSEISYEGSSNFLEIRNSTEGEQQANDYVSIMDEVFPPASVIVLISIFGIMMIFGMLANTITFIVILKTKKTAFNVLIMSLCVSDFVSAINSPWQVYRAFKAFDNYELPKFFCKMGLSVDFWTSTATIQHILTFSLLRLYCIKFPHNFSKITVKGALITAICIWVETFSVGFVMYAMWPGVNSIPGTNPQRFKCGMTKAWAPTMFKYAMVAFPILIYAPMTIIVLSCLSICIILAKRRNKRKMAGRQKSPQEKCAIIQLFLIVLSFLLGYSVDVSYRVSAISSIILGNPLSAKTEVVWSISSHFVLRFSECLNPVLYNFASSELRVATKRFLANCCVRESSERTFTFGGNSNASKHGSKQTISDKIPGQSNCDPPSPNPKECDIPL